MAKFKNSSQNPLILKYLKKYKEDPESVIFAPLAEAYRKEGLLKEAIEICKEGLSNHPNLPSGRVTLSRCYADLKKYSPIVKLLQSVVDEYPENIVALELFANANLETKNLKTAYEYMNRLYRLLPNRTDVADKIQDLKSELGDTIEPPSTEFQQVPIPPAVTEHADKSISPLTPHILVDLYISQGKEELARSVLGHILEHDPNDAPAQEKLKNLSNKESIDSRVEVLEKLLLNVSRIRQERQSESSQKGQ